MLEILTYGFMQKAILGGLGIAIITSIVGPFLVLRRLSLIGDGLAHLAFGGVALGMLLHYNPLLVALVFVLIGSLLVRKLVKKNIYGDAAIALILSFGVGLGVLIIGIAHGFNADLFSFLIGSILTLNSNDLIIIFAVLLITAMFILINYRKLVLLSFNEELAGLTQKNNELADIFFTILVALTVVISIRAVGILLVSALLVIPSLIALRISKSFGKVMIVSIAASLITMALGIIAAYYLDLPPSGLISLFLLTSFVIASIVPWKI